MATKSVRIELTGITPLLMHRYPMEEIEAIAKKTPAEQAEIAAYRVPAGEYAGQLYVPGIALRQALVAGGVFSKGKGRASLQKSVSACVMVMPEYLLLGTEKFIIDSRPVVMPSTKGRVMRYRPRIDEWSVVAEIEFDDALITEKQLRQIVDDTGKRVGLLDFRPEKKGMFGRFVVTNWN